MLLWPILIHSYLLPGFSVKAGVEPTWLLGARSHEIQQSFDVDKEGRKSNFHEDEFTIDIRMVCVSLVFYTSWRKL